MKSAVGILVLYVASYTFADILVSLPDGRIRGHERTTHGNTKFHSFQGIPYASPPIGKLRFQAPTPPKKWNGILNATSKSNICYQVKSDSPDENEDCLYINVNTPVINNKDATKLPVIFDIYGGGFTHGSASSGGIESFIDEDIVVVSHNYRVGPFGFLATGDNVIPGNAGLKDQLLALKWTHNNIHLFGGDPTKITLVGASAGGASVGYHMLSPKSKGLFRAGIAQSGCALSIWGFNSDPRSYAVNLAYQINKKTINDTKTLADYLQKVTAKEIDIASTKTEKPTSLPVIEKQHEDAFITKDMYEMVNSGEVNKVPLLTGTVSEEEISQAKNLENLKNHFTMMKEHPTRLIPTDLKLQKGVNAATVGENIFKLYFSDVSSDEILGHLVRYYSHDRFSRSVIRFADMLSKFTPVYFYQFSYVGKMGGISSDTRIKGADAIGHGGEQYYLVRSNDLSRYPAADVLTHKRMTKMWANFVKTLNPTPTKIELLQNLSWPKVEPNNYRYLDIDKDLTIKTDPKGVYYKTWKTLYDRYGARPFTTY